MGKAASKRRRINLTYRDKLIVALRELGYEIHEVQFDHTPAWGMRPWDEEKQDVDPPSRDLDYIQMIVVADHAVKTKADIKAIAKCKRLENERNGMPKTKQKARKYNWPSRKIGSKGWERR